MDNSLDGRLVEKPPLGSKQCVLIARNICSSLAYLHSLSPQVIHRDVKSQNILLSGFSTSLLDESVDVAKLADFGTVRPDDLRLKQGISTGAKLRTDGKTHAVTTRVVGTGPYMPPEYAGLGHVSAKTDAFAMGIVIIELLIARAIEVEHIDDYPLKARVLVDTEDYETLSAVLQDMASNGGCRQQRKAGCYDPCRRGSRLHKIHRQTADPGDGAESDRRRVPVGHWRGRTT
jgi:serine/threonine protein kinase